MCQHVAICVLLKQAKQLPEAQHTLITVTTATDKPQTVTIVGSHDKL